jgi:hypothetical protein
MQPVHEGAIGEIVNLRAEFLPGLGRLALLGDRFVYVGENNGSFDFSRVFGLESQVGSNRDFFMACVELWLGASTKPDLIAGVCTAEHTSLLAVGRQTVAVVTTDETGELDPNQASFVTERVFKGRFVSIETDVSNPDGVHTCFSDGGLLPAQGFRLLLSGALQVPRVHMTTVAMNSARHDESRPVSLGESNAAFQQYGPQHEPQHDPLNSTKDPEEATGQVPFPRSELTPRELEPETAVSSPSPVALVSPKSDFFYDEIDDEYLDGATVWPARQRMPPVTPASDATSVPAPAVVRSECEVAILSANPSAKVTPVEGPSPSRQAEHADTSTNASDQWEPPAPIHYVATSAPNTELSPAARTPIVVATPPDSVVHSPVADPLVVNPPVMNSLVAAESKHAHLETVTWSTPIITRGAQREEPEYDETELTIMAGDLARLRKSFVELAPSAMAEAPAGTVLGAYCGQGHFTDVRKGICIFCGDEVNFETNTNAPRPSLGVLTFDNGQTIQLTSAVVIGRKPSSHDSTSQLVEFEEDKMLSRTHTEVRLVDWDVAVVDRQSVNGTIVEHVDGRRINSRPNIETRLEQGTIVRFGNHSFTYRRT